MNDNTTARVRIWDLPVRLVHWLLAATFLSAFAIATLTDDDGALFGFHALLGLLALSLAIVRIVWGLAGSRWARFGSFDLRVSSLARYLREIPRRRSERSWPGHNPATAWFALASLVLIMGLGVTGIATARGSELAEEIHEVLAWSMAALAGIHIAGVAWHRVRRGENLAAAMVTGWKNAPRAEGIRSFRPWSGAVVLLLAGITALFLITRYDAATRRLMLPLPGGPLQIAEAEEHEGSETDLRGHHSPEDEEDDD